MAVQFVDGKVLFVGGAVAMSSDCCCDPAVCCTFDPARPLYLTISGFTIDAGCDAGCTGFAISGKHNFGGDLSAAHLTTWYTEECGDDGNFIIAYTLLCDAAGDYGPVGHFRLNMFSGSYSRIIDNCEDFNTLCFISLSTTGAVTGNDQPLGAAICDPFYLEADVNIDIYASDGTTLCSTGTMHVIISE